jgi:putative drug exporter of the RND superfamily
MTAPTRPPKARAGMLTRLVRGCAEHPRRTMAAWLVLVIAILGIKAAWGGRYVNNTTIPGSEAQQATDLLEAKFPEVSGDAARIVFASDTPLTDSAGRQAVEAASEAARGVPGVISVGDPYAGRSAALTKDGTVAFLNVQFDKPARELENDQIVQLEDDVRAATADSPVEVELGGPVIEAKQVDSHTSEVLGFAAAVLVLLLVLGTFTAMSVPIAAALVSIITGMSILLIAAAYFDFHTITPVLAVMIGLGVAIDYALFIVTRFRQELAKGAEPVEAAVTAGTTAGRAVIFAGSTVAISISGLAFVGIPFVALMGYGSAIAVIVAVCTALTLLPAMLAKVGHNIDKGRLPWTRKRAAATTKRGIVGRIAELTARRPRLVVVAVLGVLLTMAIPVLSINLGTADSGSAPSSTTQRKAYDLVADNFGPGVNGPLFVAVDQPNDPHASTELAQAFAKTPGVAAVAKPMVNPAGDAAQIIVIPTTSPQSNETSDLVNELRDNVIPRTLAGSDAHAYVGGTTAGNEDIATKMSQRMPYFLLFVVGVLFLVISMAFRSVVVALKAALTTMLSALAAFGALVAVFEWGWVQGIVGLDKTGPTASFLPVIVLSILFGLSMDYEVFLASRIREEYVNDGDPRRAVKNGVNAVGRVIMAAAVIMGVVFSAFVLTDDRTIKSFGLGLAVAILVDALLVRMLLVPALLHLLGKRAWYMPKWLDRLLPKLTIEPEEERPVAAAQPLADAGDDDDVRELEPVG